VADTALDTELLAAALDLINEFGKDVTITTLASQVYDPDTGFTTEGAATDLTVKASPPTPMTDKYGMGDIIEEGDTIIFVAGSGITFTPAKNLKITIDTEVWRIVNVIKLYSGESVAAFGLQLRQ